MKSLEDQIAELEYLISAHDGEVQVLEARIKELEELLKQHGIDVPPFSWAPGQGGLKSTLPK